MPPFVLYSRQWISHLELQKKMHSLRRKEVSWGIWCLKVKILMLCTYNVCECLSMSVCGSVYCIRGSFRCGFNFASQSSRKFPLQYMAIYSYENIRKIMKLSHHKFPHLLRNHKNVFTRNIWRIQYLFVTGVCNALWNPTLPSLMIFIIFSRLKYLLQKEEKEETVKFLLNVAFKVSFNFYIAGLLSCAYILGWVYFFL